MIKVPKNKGFAPKKKYQDPQSLRLKGDRCFKIAIESNVVNSWVKCSVLNIETCQSASLRFHLYSKGGMGYAEVAIPREDFYLHGWVGDNISLISPMVCRAVLASADILVINA